uniref:AlNc14C147G7417 protein n=1 Tax=Albugo laibachii Nc14 TaxID=890382 RepID=F0WLM8_9STRA|nr:AlNc14C147G7417 [Albugo laibachii Nc14]|eukprot:CCA22194.1 AlNc14C147G7417 [Albugo laibachii Nc14]
MFSELARILRDVIEYIKAAAMSRSALTRHAMQKSVASCAPVIPDEETAYVNEAEHTRHIKHDEIPM